MMLTSKFDVNIIILFWRQYLILSSTSEYDSTSLNLYLSSHTAFHLILFTISFYSYILYIKQLHAHRAWNSTFYNSFYHTY